MRRSELVRTPVTAVLRLGPIQIQAWRGGTWVIAINYPVYFYVGGEFRWRNVWK